MLMAGAAVVAGRGIADRVGPIAVGSGEADRTIAVVRAKEVRALAAVGARVLVFRALVDVLFALRAFELRRAFARVA